MVVTGGGGAIGREVGLALAREGATVFAVGRTGSSLRAVAAESDPLPGEIKPTRADLTDDDSVQRLVADIERQSQGIAGLIHCAGAHVSGSIIETPVGELDRQLRINLHAPYLLTQLLLPLLEADRGQVVFVNSSAVRRARAGLGSYAASKHALRALADSLREEVNAVGIRVLSVYPGRTASPMQASLHRIEGRSYYPDRLLQPSDVATAIVAAMLLPRTAEVTDLDIRPMAKPDDD
jgi:NAD(P)-dependent dehydrogenase (short-subunit alcohol dehydrogenase family)